MKKHFVIVWLVSLMLFSSTTYLAAQKVTDNQVTKEKTKLLESYGLLSSSSLYLSYLSLTYIERDILKANTKEELNTIVQSVHNINTMIKKDLEKLKSTVKLSDEDHKFMNSLTEIADLLLEDANLLKKYANSRKSQDRQKYLDHHALLFDKMNSLFYEDKENEKAE